MKVIANVTLRTGEAKDNKFVQSGKEVDLPEKEARDLAKRGLVSLPGEVDSVWPTPPVEVKVPPSIDDIIEVILQLDPAKDYTNAGVPHVQAIEGLLGANISAVQRDEAWGRIQDESNENPDGR